MRSEAMFYLSLQQVRHFPKSYTASLYFLLYPLIALSLATIQAAEKDLIIDKSVDET